MTTIIKGELIFAKIMVENVKQIKKEVYFNLEVSLTT